MQNWIKLFWAICLFQKGPQNLRYSVSLFWLLLFGALLLDMLTLFLSVPGVDFGTGILIVAANMLVSLGSLALLLYLLGFGNRINQTFNSFLGAGLIISLLAVPPLALLPPEAEPAGLAVIMLLMLHIWGLLISAHILHHALSVNRIVSAVLAIGFFMLSVWLMNTLLPETA